MKRNHPRKAVRRPCWNRSFLTVMSWWRIRFPRWDFFRGDRGAGRCTKNDIVWRMRILRIFCKEVFRGIQNKTIDDSQVGRMDLFLILKWSFFLKSMLTHVMMTLTQRGAGTFSCNWCSCSSSKKMDPRNYLMCKLYFPTCQVRVVRFYVSCLLWHVMVGITRSKVEVKPW